MPRYDYKCSACGHVYEKREGFDAPPVQPCRDCSGEARRVLTPPAIVFKGSGWYATDSRKGSAGTDSAPAATESKSDSSDSKDAKPVSTEKSSEKSGEKTSDSAGAKSTPAAPSSPSSTAAAS